MDFIVRCTGGRRVDREDFDLQQELPELYGDLRRLAAQQMASERPDHTLTTTALVHEAYMRIVRQDKEQWENRAQFCAVAARMMRRILVDHARGKRSGKRQHCRLSVDLNQVAGQESPVDVLAVHDLLDSLERLNSQHARIAEMRFFAGMSIAETASALELSTTTVTDHWRVARAWLLSRLNSSPEDPAVG